jgi:hypothetical protein
MEWVIGLMLLLILLLCWILFSLLSLELDTRVPQAGIKWGIIGKVRIWYDDVWRLRINAPFYEKTFCLSELKTKPRKIKTTGTGKKEKKKRSLRTILKMITAITKTFRVTEWKLAMDTGDHTLNAPLYPLNFLPHTANHLFVNFQNENYLVLKVRNRPWKIVYVILKFIFLKH